VGSFPEDASAEPARPGTRAALVVAHPGHELLVHGWLEQVQPVVFVLTDGSGRTGQSRLAATAAILDRAGARAGTVFGRWSDAALYDVIREARTDLLRQLVDELVRRFLELEIDLVAGDALEGYNPSHDLARYAVNACVRRLARRHGRAVANYEFRLTEPPADPLVDGELVHRLDDAAFQRKLRAAESSGALREEVARLTDRMGLEAFRVERLLRVHAEVALRRFDDVTPFYESWGTRRVAEGHYPTVIRYHEHVRPLAHALWAYADGG
jgi:hypothetical protein